MRKMFALFLLLLTVAVGGVSVAAVGIGGRADEVTVSVISHEGDPSVLEGLQVDLHSYCQNLRWDTCFIPETGKVSTEFRYMGNGGDNDRRTEPQYGLTMQDETGHTMHYDPEDTNPQGLDQVYHELAETTQPGEQGIKTIFLKDYLDYYQLDLHVYTPQDTFYWGHNWDLLTKGERELYQGFLDFFRIPILPDETWSMTYQKVSSSDAVSLGCGTTDSDKFDLSVGKENSVVTDSGVYFTFTNRTDQGNIIDTSLIPGGYGIYCLPIVRDFDPKTETAFRADQLHVAYPMEEETEFLGLRASKDKSRLVLHTIEDGWYVCTEIDIQTMTTIQRFEIAPLREKNNNWELWEDKEQDLFIVELFGEQSALFYRTDGSYSLEFIYEHDSVRLLEHWSSDLAYNGEQLFVGEVGYWKEHTGEEFFILSAYDSSGLRYYGTYDISLTRGAEDRYAEEVKPIYRKPIVLDWN